MKNITLALAALLAGTSGVLVADEQTKERVEIAESAVQERLGKEAMGQIREKYNQGAYQEFLQEMHASYEAALEKGQLEGLISLRQSQSIDSKWVDTARELHQEKNREIAKIAEGQEGSFAEKARSATQPLTSAEQDEALMQIAQLRHMAPGQGQNEEENRLIDLDVEYEYKMIHLSMPTAEGQKAQEMREKQYALLMEKADKMLALSQSFEDQAMKKRVELATQNLDERLAQNWDHWDLNALFKSGVKPTDPLQEKVLSALQSYHDKMSELTRQTFENAMHSE